MKTNKILLSDAIVYVVDDDASIRSGLSSLLRSQGVQVFTYDAPEGFLNTEMPDVPSCLILDIRLRGANGLNLQQHALREGMRLPIIFLTAHGDIPMSVQAMKAGAFDFITKPFRDQEMIDTVAAALTWDHELRIKERLVANIQRKYAALTPREKEVVVLVAEGLMNKQIAGRMGLSEETVKIHRSHAMRKLEALSVPDLVRKLQRIAVTYHRSSKSP